MELSALKNVIYRQPLRIGYYKGYHGNELSEAVAEFSSKYPTVEVSIIVGSHEELYKALETDKVDLVLNDQRRAFSDLYNNEILSESRMYIEISNLNPLSRLETVEIAELKNTPCILVINSAGQGYMPVDVIGNQTWFDSTIDRIPLVRNGEPVRKTYCAFWRKDNSGYYIEDFAEMLKKTF